MSSRREQFVKDAYRQAREAGLNDQQARLAASQAALETGYGKSVVGNNYYGIKAGSSWNGPSVLAGTWEDTANGPKRQPARFRSYSSPVQAFGDWASTLGRRWSSAFNAPTFDEAVDGLNYGKPGGYATDRNYGAKLRSINRRYGPQADEVDGIMAAINPAATATPTPRPMPTSEQYSLLDTARGLARDMRPAPAGLLAASYPSTPARVERQDLPAVGTPSLGTNVRVASAAPMQGPHMPSLSDEVAEYKQTPEYAARFPGQNVGPAAAAPKMSLAEQYAAYGQGQVAARNMGLLAQDVADFRLTHPAAAPATVGAAAVQPSQVQGPAPQVDVPGPTQPSQIAQPQYNAPQGGGLLSPAEYEMVRQQQMNLDAMGPNRMAQAGNLAKGALTRIGGGILGGMLLGPVGAIAGGLLAPKALTSITRNDGFPDKPKGVSKGDGRMNDYGRSVQHDSRQFDRAVRSGTGGLW